jgi:hypothetical protein
VLLIDDDKPRLSKGRNSAERAPATTCTSRPVTTCRQTFSRIFAAHVRMPFAGRAPNRVLETLEEGSRQRDFRAAG